MSLWAVLQLLYGELGQPLSPADAIRRDRTCAGDFACEEGS